MTANKNKLLLQQFRVEGFFYKKGQNTFRKYLNIKKVGSDAQIPDLIVVMMNPGASRPIGSANFKNIDKCMLNSVVPTVPDSTQYQIMQVMLKFSYNFVRVLNLSDTCEADSKTFYKKLKDLEVWCPEHSIFYNSRKVDLDGLFEPSAKVLVAWGVNKALKYLAETALIKIGKNRIGCNKQNIDWAYYHPLPRNSEKQLEWLDKIIKQFK